MNIVLMALCICSLYADFFQHNMRIVTSGCLVIFLAAIMATAYNISDEMNYVMYYEASKYFTGDLDPMAALWFHYNSDIGYTITNYIFYGFGFNYYEYKMTVIPILMFIVYYITNKLNKMVGVVLVLYLLYPFFFDVPQIRNLFVEILLLAGLYCYSKSHKIGYYAALMFVAACFHKIALVYILFLAIEYLLKRNLGRKVVYLWTIIGFMMPLYASLFIGKLSDIQLLLIGMDGFAQYAAYANTEMQFGFMIPWMHVVSLGAVVYYIYCKIDKDNISDLQIRFIESVWHMYLMFCLIMPLFAIHGDLSRIPRNILLPTYLVFAIYLNSLPARTMKIKFFIGIFLVVLVIAYVELYMVPSLVTLPNDILENNILVDICRKLME